MSNIQQAFIEQLQEELGANEDTEHLIDWVIDLWSTLEIFTDRFGEARAIQIVIASAPLPRTSKREAVLV